MLLILFVGINTESPHLKNTKSEKKKKVPHYHFSPAFFSPPLICITNKNVVIGKVVD
jgi:hypothetical protein